MREAARPEADTGDEDPHETQRADLHRSGRLVLFEPRMDVTKHPDGSVTRRRYVLDLVRFELVMLEGVEEGEPA